MIRGSGYTPLWLLIMAVLMISRRRRLVGARVIHLFVRVRRRGDTTGGVGCLDLRWPDLGWVHIGEVGQRRSQPCGELRGRASRKRGRRHGMVDSRRVCRVGLWHWGVCRRRVRLRSLGIALVIPIEWKLFDRATAGEDICCSTHLRRRRVSVIVRVGAGAMGRMRGRGGSRRRRGWA
jgi:hypothetical protein